MSTYTIENAKSGRATCKKCKEKIGKGELRIGTHADLGDKVMSSWNHPLCFNLPRKFSKISAEEFVSDYLTDNTDAKILDDPTEKQQIIEQIDTKATKKQTKKAQQSGSKYMAAVKRNADQLLAESGGEEGPAKKKVKLSDDDKAKANAYIKFIGMKIGELQDILSWNNVLKTGTKDVLLTRVIDGFVYGRIGKCVACKLGQPKISDDGSKIECKGYFNSDKGFPVPCGNTVAVESAVRFKPWYINEPTEEEENAMKEESNISSSDSNENLPDTMVKAVNKFEWKLSSKENIKKAANGMVDLCSSEESPIDFPSDKAKAKIDIGMMIVQNKGKTALDVLNLIVEKYGYKKKNDEVAENDQKQVGAMLAVDQNASVYMAMQELSTIYFKEKNTNAGISYRKVANAVKDLDFEITAKNAKGLGKGKTKVDNIGKSSAEKIHELVTTGKIQKLEEKRAAHS
mmetsp:Transcript_23641/g.35163  ORF Transcript_23641/g.35163 Transcript_23641/m.35163 type:complete len:458 (-) Transcript_23641:1161-2534(-)